MSSVSRAACALLVLLAGASAMAAPIAERDVPTPLKPWIDWVLYGQERSFCPPVHHDANQRLCRWPAQLRLQLDGSGGRFDLHARLDAPGWLILPGNTEVWPQNVEANGRDAPVLFAENAPALLLPAGEHRISGQFLWSALPEALQLPADAGLIELSLAGRELPHPARDTQGRLWLGRSAVTPAAQGDHLDLRVFRLIDDDIPLRLITRLQIEAGGAVREEKLGPVLPQGLIPLSLDGDLPARLEDDGRLTVQLRPGLWTVTLTARAPGPVTALAVAKNEKPWPPQEVWSFQAHPDLRVIEISGAAPVDPRQTAMPEEWRELPAYLLNAGDALKLDLKQRGLSRAQPDDLHLQRQIWLDFDGGGYTLQDHLHGTLASRWRLQASAPIVPGRVEVDGQPLLITQLTDEFSAGVEVRRGALNLVADSRVYDDTRRLPAAGWNVDLQSVETRLHLPPAWRLLAAPGADSAPDSWLMQWTLLDLFLVLIAGIASFRVFGRATGALTLVTLVLIWHQDGAPRYAWLNLIAVIALLRALPEDYARGRLRAWLDRYRWVSAAVLVLIAIPFVLQQARTALHPQLELGGFPALDGFTSALEQDKKEAGMAAPEAPPPPMADMAAGAEVRQMVQSAPAGRYALKSLALDGSKLAQQNIQQLDPKANVQTGPGVPQWSWREARLSWSGPVTEEQTFRLWLMPPWLTRVLRVVSIVLIALLLLGWLKPPAIGGLGGLRQLLRWPGRASAAVALLACFTGGVAIDARAAVAPPEPEPPPPQLLEELRQRLLAPPECMPACAQIPQLAVQVNADDALSLRLAIDAQTETAVPLPVPPLTGADQGGVWQPETVLIDGKPADTRRSPDGSLWLRAPAGRHQLAIGGSLGGLSQLRLPLPLQPRRASVTAPGWRIAGIDAQARPGAVIELVRETADADASDAGARQALPPFLVVTRTLSLGPDWDVSTRVERIGSSSGAYVASIAMLKNEVVTGEAVRVDNGAVLLSLAPGQTTASWTSRLALSPQLELKAPSNAAVFEVWRFDVSPLWHAEFEGLPPVQEQENGFRLPVYRPWPGEALRVALIRPQGVEGQVLTLDRSELTMSPGKRVSDLDLSLALRASQGGQHVLKLPADIEVQSLSIDGEDQPARIENGNLVLPLHPGAQDVQLSLRENRGVSTWLSTPALNLGLPGVNAHLAIDLPEDRWVLWTSGPQLGPAVLFWPVLAVLLFIAWGLGRTGLTPLGTRQWMLLMIGLSQLSVWGAAVVVGWLLSLGARGRFVLEGPESRFNVMQVLLVLLTLFALSLLFGAVAQGLLGAPDMQIEGNGSYGNALRWFQDRHTGELPQAAALSVSIWVYRVLMLLWALWLANSLLGWLRWGWDQFSRGGLWRKKPPSATPVQTPSPENPTP